MKNRMVWLVSDWDYRQPNSKLQDIECGHHLEGLQELSQSVRMMIEDADMRCETDAYGRIMKIVKKRDPEFGYDRQEYFLLDKQGHKRPVTEEEMDQWLGIDHDPEDLYNQKDLEFVPLNYLGLQEQEEILDEDLYLDDIDELDSEDPDIKVALHSNSVTPMDRWDVVFDATEYLTVMKRIVDQEQLSMKWVATLPKEAQKLLLSDSVMSRALNKLGPDASEEDIQWVENTFQLMSSKDKQTLIDSVADRFIYSAPYFIAKADKRPRTKMGRLALQKVEACQDRSEVGRLAYGYDPQMRIQRTYVETQKALISAKTPKDKVYLATKAAKLCETKMKGLRAFKYVDLEDDTENPSQWKAVQINKRNNSSALPLVNEVKYIWDRWRQAQAMAGK